MNKNGIYLFIVAASWIGFSSIQVSAKTFTESLQQGSSIKVNFRTRYEDVSEDGLKDSDALTTRSRLTYQSGAWNGFALMMEMDDVSELTGEVDYRTAPNDPLNNTTTIIADPVGTEVNQGFISYTTFNNQVKYGRQRLVLDNARFIGNVGWRQNEQTYDALSWTNKAIRYTNLTYAYINNVNRIFGEANLLQGDHAHDSHILNASYTGFTAGKLIGYAYLLENESSLLANRNLSSDTFGIRWQGTISDMFAYNLEYAKQQDAGFNQQYDADYLLAEGTFTFLTAYTVGLGYEVLGSDEGNYGFTTSLATLHAFQGWADKFLNTPAVGIKDAYLNLGATFMGVVLAANFHQYDADEGNQDLGNEIGFSAMKKWGPVAWSLKYADYSMGDVTTYKDTKKLWLMADWNF
jgi:Alginate export